MSVPSPDKTQVPFDEDEDLFRFDELYAEKEEAPGSELDLDEFLKAFEQATATPEQAEAAASAAVAVAEAAVPAPAAQAPVATAPQPVAVPVAGALRLSRGVLAAVGALLVLQVGASLLVWIGGARARAQMEERGVALHGATTDLRREFERRTAELTELTRPIVGPQVVATGETFARVERHLAQGRFGEARRELFATLAIVDRFDGEARDDMEARARFLLADSYRLEADRR